jgi:hypothetical protein
MTDVGPQLPGGRRVAPAPVDALLRFQAAPRLRTTDDHMFAVPHPFGRPASFRLQLFTTPGFRPVAVATQTISEGASLVNAAERYAAAVWQEHFPDDLEPPIWIQRLLLDGFTEFQLVQFAVAGEHELSNPAWFTLSPDELAHLVGAPVDEDRGEGYIPRPPEPEEELQYKVIWAARLPRPAPFRAPGCMPSGISWPDRLRRQILRRTDVRDCCEYHSVNWHRVSRTAIRIARQADRSGARGDELADQARALAESAEDLTPAERAAAATLVCPAEGIQLCRSGTWRTAYVNGQHRSQAILGAGVLRTVIVRWRQPASL